MIVLQVSATLDVQWYPFVGVVVDRVVLNLIFSPDKLALKHTSSRVGVSSVVDVSTYTLDLTFEQRNAQQHRFIARSVLCTPVRIYE